ncbi:hypothetical protein [Caldifermentibacillus hisashii]|jgi:hypothetical protein|uniref:hypothetical protein n=1 Tax=Caldifermentibacillus hisashii TaxID=996558 RepID=UPI003D19C298
MLWRDKGNGNCHFLLQHLCPLTAVRNGGKIKVVTPKDDKMLYPKASSTGKPTLNGTIKKQLRILKFGNIENKRR